MEKVEGWVLPDLDFLVHAFEKERNKEVMGIVWSLWNTD